ncbi:hypothetical protein [Shewanella donghaensis]|uniref:hypothetical protein n=1 Tax=Shewanella donghaensis TaxID=238836 RepID=UPI0011845DFC|nr:hypothetical protein [Shewanella donghaensis]
MQYIDPLTAECELCGSKNEYPLKDILEYKVACKSCMIKMTRTALTIHKEIREHNLEVWPIHFLLDALDIFKLDIDDISENEIEKMTHINDFNVVLKRHKCGQSIQMILNTPSMCKIKSEIDISKLEEYSLNELALLAYPDIKMANE